MWTKRNCEMAVIMFFSEDKDLPEDVARTIAEISIDVAESSSIYRDDKGRMDLTEIIRMTMERFVLRMIGEIEHPITEVLKSPCISCDLEGDREICHLVCPGLELYNMQLDADPRNSITKIQKVQHEYTEEHLLHRKVLVKEMFK